MQKYKKGIAKNVKNKQTYLFLTKKEKYDLQNYSK